MGIQPAGPRTLSWDLRESIHDATLVELRNVIRTLAREYPTVWKLAKELTVPTKEGLRDFVIGVCEDGTGKEIFCRILSCEETQHSGSSKKPRFQDMTSVTHPSGSTSLYPKAPKVLKSYNVNQASIAKLRHPLREDTPIPVISEAPRNKKRKTVEDIFSNETKRRETKDFLREQRRREDETIFANNKDIGIAKCAQCNKHFEKAENEATACAFHPGK